MHLAIPQVIFEAIPKDETDQARRYRGYIALDDVNFKPGSHCRGHCTFDAGLCGFKNSDRADFDRSVVSRVNVPRNLVSEFGPVSEASAYLIASLKARERPYELSKTQPKVKYFFPNNGN